MRIMSWKRYIGLFAWFLIIFYPSVIYVSVDTALYESDKDSVFITEVKAADEVIIDSDVVDEIKENKVDKSNSTSLEKNESSSLELVAGEKNVGTSGDVSSKSQTSVEKRCLYCGSFDHLIDVCVEKAVANGAEGRWIIPDVGIDVACYPSNEQSVCDSADSACYFSYGDQTIIADHDYQGFSALFNCKEGTLAYLSTAEGIKKYKCTRVFNGHNRHTQPYLTDIEGNSLRCGYNTGGITCYTCNGHWENIFICFFTLVD